jgi:hypothetical protein
MTEPESSDTRTLPGPVYAVAGAGDLVAERVRRLIAQAPALQAQLQRGAAGLPDDLREIGRSLPGELQSFVADLPSYAASMSGKAQRWNSETLRRNADEVQGRVQDAYAALVRRGEKATGRSSGPDGTVATT